MTVAYEEPAQPARASVIQLNIRDTAALYAAYIPIFKEGGIFLATERACRMGESLLIMLTLPGDSRRYPIDGVVSWVTPAGASGGRVQGVGVRFRANAMSSQLRASIEQQLGPVRTSERVTHTV